MSQCIRALRLLAPVVLMASWGLTASAAEPMTAAVETFAQPDGSSLFAVSLEPKMERPAAGPSDLVVMFDTSASQANDYRATGLETLEAFLATLGEEHRVQLYAVDLKAIPLTSTFVGPRSDEMQKAMTDLKARVPLGSTDMEAALDTVCTVYANAPTDRSRAVVYIGDGMSQAQFIATPRMQELVTKLVSLRVPVSSYAIGPRTDTFLLGTLANHTGGFLGVDGPDLKPREVATYMVAAATEPVLWPTQATLPPELTVYPRQMPPLRFDRDTVLVGSAKTAPTGTISIRGEMAGQPVETSWTLAAQPPQADNNYLVEVVRRAERDGGLSMPLPGSVGLRMARGVANMKAHGLAMLAQQAASLGSYDQAEQLSTAALKIDSTNPQALAMQKTVTAQRAAAPSGEGDIRLVNLADGATEVRTPEPDEGDYLREAEAQKRLLEQKLRAEIQHAMNDARELMGTSPDAVQASLKPWLDQVRQATELSPEVKQQLVDQLESLLRESSRQVVVQTERNKNRQIIAAEVQARQEITRDLYEGQERTKQLLDRFEGLMDEGRYLDARNVAELAQKGAPDVLATRSAVEDSDFVAGTADAQMAKLLRERGTQRALSTMEYSAAPYDDNVPVAYPDPEWWKLMSARREVYNNVDLAQASENEAKIIRALDENTELDVIEATLTDVLDLFEMRHKIPIEIDARAFQEGAVATDTPITKTLSGISLRSALRLILRDIGATYVIRDDVLLITTQQAAEDVTQYGSTKVYPVADLVIPIENTGINGFGSVSGGGGFGGSGGFGGGGMGGGGMGGGGFGGGGGGMFAVPDDLVLTGESTAPAPAPAQPATDAATANPAPASDPIHAIKLEASADADPFTAWSQHFAAHQERSADVRQTVRELMQAKRFDQIIGLVQAAIQNRQAQPWMYEALGLSMQLQGSRPEDIERALMSAIDMSNRPTDLLHVARYMLMSMQGNRPIEERALKLLEQVATLEPTDPQAFVEGLALATRLADVHGIQWSAAGILSQAWSAEQRPIADRALNAAKAMEEHLLAEKRFEEAKTFKAAIDEAMVRDCMVVVTWTGGADIDLVVEEPGGTLCTFRNPRSTGGGMLLDDSLVSNASGKGISEVYVCPKGFDGTYKMKVRRVWGEPTADRVTVDYYVKRRTKDEKHMRKQIKLDDKGEAVLAFELAGGRRTEPLAETQVANAVANQMAVGRAILGQQLNAASDPRALSSYVNGAPIGEGFPTNPISRLLGRGAVGYQPVIITLPEGINMSAVAVVSSDRRYVRVTSQPLFSNIPNVNVFNYATGSSGTGLGGTASIGAASVSTGTDTTTDNGTGLTDEELLLLFFF